MNKNERAFHMCENISSYVLGVMDSAIDIDRRGYVSVNKTCLDSISSMLGELEFNLSSIAFGDKDSSNE